MPSPIESGPYLRRGGTTGTGPTLLLLHGLGQTADLWTGVLELLDKHRSGRWIVIDLPGHGRSARLPDYSYESMTRAVAEVLDPDEPLIILGHSLGGVIAIMLGSGRYGLDIQAVCALGVKPDPWPEGADDVARAMATTPPQAFPSKAVATDHLLSLISAQAATDAATPTVRRWWDTATAEHDGAWTLCLDQQVYAVGTHDMQKVVSQCRAPLILAAGTLDPLGSPEHLLELDRHAVLLDGEDHYPHLHNPESLTPLIELLSIHATDNT
ncbi:alpha/beta hydrolase [Nocardia sp. NPDC052112]|uniref:alpha/beta fold hydrolase n=1 Tax=Nocardia sp. NPDC052112 TaxID=3155646 RepID=UPI00343F8053